MKGAEGLWPKALGPVKRTASKHDKSPFLRERGDSALQKADDSLSLFNSFSTLHRMHLFHRVRQLSAWSRALLVGFILAFGLNGIVHAAHQHDPDSAATSLHSTACGYCVSFDSLATTPAQPELRVALNLDSRIVLPAATPAPWISFRSIAQPRAPPIH